jgi:hypothetical protein
MRYAQLFLVFLLSGILHQAMDVAQGMRWAESGALEFFMLMAAGIVVEDGFQWAAGPRHGAIAEREKKASETLLDKPLGRSRMASKLVGYIWVLLFFSYATPIWVYPQFRRNTGTVRDDPIPISLVGMVGRR